MPLPSAGLPDCSSGLAQRIYNNLKYDSKWQASQAVAVGAVCCPTVPTGFGWRCTTAGTTAGSEPAWPGSPTVGTTTQAESSGTVVWTCDAVANPGGRVTSVNLGYVLTASDLDYLRLLPYVIARAVADELAADNEAWIPVVGGVGFTGTWVNFGAGGQPAGYFKDANGIVRLRGLIKSGTSGTSAFTLPNGYRPSVDQFYAVDAGGAYGRVKVNASGGSVIPDIGLTTATALDNISFDTR